MAGSRRRAKRTRPVVSVKKRKKPRTVAAVPRELTDRRPSIAAKLGAGCGHCSICGKVTLMLAGS
jgi:hypothetical protein